MKNPAYAIGTGRCGTKFLHTLFSQEPEVSSGHELDPLNDTFFRFCKWYGVDVDSQGFLQQKKIKLLEDASQGKLSFESSAYLSLSVRELHDAFDAKFVLMVRHPVDVVKSYLSKGWYQNPISYSGQGVPSYQLVDQFHHFLGRPMAVGDEYNDWKKSNRTQKLAWYWRELNQRVLDQFHDLPDEAKMVVKLEDFKYPQYEKVAAFLGLQQTMSEKKFYKISEKRPNRRGKSTPRPPWTEDDRRDVIDTCGTLMSSLGYDLGQTFP